MLHPAPFIDNERRAARCRVSSRISCGSCTSVGWCISAATSSASTMAAPAASPSWLSRKVKLVSVLLLCTAHRNCATRPANTRSRLTSRTHDLQRLDDGSPCRSTRCGKRSPRVGSRPPTSSHSGGRCWPKDWPLMVSTRSWRRGCPRRLSPPSRGRSYFLGRRNRPTRSSRCPIILKSSFPCTAPTLGAVAERPDSTARLKREENICLRYW